MIRRPPRSTRTDTLIPYPTLVRCALDPAGVGIGHQLDRLAMHGLKACFFVDPMPALVFGFDWLKPLVATILARGQEVQLHLHPNWAGAKAGDGGAAHARFEMVEYSRSDERRVGKECVSTCISRGSPYH